MPEYSLKFYFPTHNTTQRCFPFLHCLKKLKLLIEKQPVLFNMNEIITLESHEGLSFFGEFLRNLFLSPYLFIP